MRILHYLIHPAQSRSVANAALWQSTRSLDGITRVDLYADYPRHNINADTEQKRLLDHDIIVFQFPMFWYAAPSLLKEWTDLVLEQGFAFGPEGDKLRGKKMLLAITTGGSAHAFTAGGYQQRDVRQYLLPYEQTAHLCQMEFLTPFVFHDAVREPAAPQAHAFAQLLTALRDETFDFSKLTNLEIQTPQSIQQMIGG